MRRICVLTPVAPAASDFLGDAYASLLKQDLPPSWEWRWIVQQDGPGRLRQSLPDDDPRISFSISQRHGGESITRNLALARADGELVRPLDADDQLTVGALARDIDVLASDTGIGWTTSRVLDLLPDGSTVGSPLDPSPGPIAPGAVLAHWRAHDYRAQVHPVTLCARRSLVLLLGGWMALPASGDTGLLLALNAVSTGYFIEQPSLLYRKWPGQLTADAMHYDPAERPMRMQLIEARAQALAASRIRL